MNAGADALSRIFDDIELTASVAAASSAVTPVRAGPGGSSTGYAYGGMAVDWSAPTPELRPRAHAYDAAAAKRASQSVASATPQPPATLVRPPSPKFPAQLPPAKAWPLRRVVFIRQAHQVDGLYHFKAGVVPEDTCLVVFDERNLTADITVDYGQRVFPSPCLARTPAEVDPHSPQRLFVVRDLNEYTNMEQYIRAVIKRVAADVELIFIGVQLRYALKDYLASGRFTYRCYEEYDDVLYAMTEAMSEADRKVLQDTFHANIHVLSYIPEDEVLYTRSLAHQLRLKPDAFKVPLGLIVLYLVSMRALVPVQIAFTASNSLVTGMLDAGSSPPRDAPLPVHPEYGIAYRKDAECFGRLLEVARDYPRLRYTTLPPIRPADLPGASMQLPALPTVDVVEGKLKCIVDKHPVVLAADINPISFLTEYCSKRALPMPEFREHSVDVTNAANNVMFRASMKLVPAPDADPIEFHSPAAYVRKSTAREEVARVAMLELGLVRPSPQLFRTMHLARDPRDVVHLTGEPPMPAASEFDSVFGGNGSVFGGSGSSDNDSSSIGALRRGSSISVATSHIAPLNGNGNGAAAAGFSPANGSGAPVDDPFGPAPTNGTAPPAPAPAVAMPHLFAPAVVPQASAPPTPARVAADYSGNYGAPVLPPAPAPSAPATGSMSILAKLQLRQQQQQEQAMQQQPYGPGAAASAPAAGAAAASVAPPASAPRPGSGSAPPASNRTIVVVKGDYVSALNMRLAQAGHLPAKYVESLTLPTVPRFAFAVELTHQSFNNPDITGASSKKQAKRNAAKYAIEQLGFAIEERE
ncbi:hypothetical protein H9P43_008219 [Blastocladiella emersonii ATCC 22665]|nr:hypothetical protein H9P43_008219 [Blastocladiella emersonii ATCC 22665]